MIPPALRNWLLRRADNYQQNLRVLLVGFAVFFFGALAVGAAELLISDQLIAEIVALGGLIMLGFGIILALLGYIALSLLRLYRFFNDDTHHD